MNASIKQVKYILMDLRPNEEIQHWESAISIQLLVPERDVEKLRNALAKLIDKEK